MKRVIVIVLAVLLATSAVQPVAAQDDTFFDDLVTEEDGIAATILEEVGNILGDLARTQDKYLGEESSDAATYADDLQASFNEQNETIAAYASERLEADADHDVATLYVHDQEGGNVTLYLVSNASNGNWTDARLVDPATFDELNRTSDFWVSMDWFVSKHAADELDRFVGEYAASNENISRSYQLKMISKYGSGIKSDLWGDESPAFGD